MYELVSYWTKEAKVEVSGYSGLDPKPKRFWVMDKLSEFFTLDAEEYADMDIMLVYCSGQVMAREWLEIGASTRTLRCHSTTSSRCGTSLSRSANQSLSSSWTLATLDGGWKKRGTSSSPT